MALPVHLPAVVTVSSTSPPPITWHCATCRRAERFACSERFRANANGKLVDVWLIYRCGRCDRTKNITVLERRPVGRVPRPLLDAAIANDAATARRLARDVGLLRRAGAAIAGPDEWTIDAPAPPSASEVVLHFPEPLLVRLDAVAAAALDVRRGDVPDLVRAEGRVDTLRLWSTVELRRQ